VENIKILLDKEMSVEVTKEDGSTTLHISSECGNLEATKNFVERGAVLKNANKYRQTPLHSAAFRGKINVFATSHK